MKFLLIASYPDSLIQFRGHLIDELLRLGFDVNVAVPDIIGDDDVYLVLNSKGVKVHNIPLKRTGMNPFLDILTLTAIFRLIRQIKPTHILGYTIKPVIYATLTAWLLKVPHRFALISGLGYAFTAGKSNTTKSILRQVIQRLYRLSLNRLDLVFFQNHDDKSLFNKLGILSDSVPSCIVNGSGVNISEYQQSDLPKESRFLMITRLLGNKGVREYAAAAKMVQAKYPRSSFSLVGWIDDNPDSILQRELDTWVTQGTIEYLGKLTDVRPAIAKCSVYVLPSYREGTPRTVLEAMAMGRPIITTDAPGCKETVIHGDNGFLVPVKAVEELASAMIRFIEEPDLLNKMGTSSRAMAEEKYDVHKVNNVMLQEMGIIKC